jgi:glycosyltransferase involved in cell wall biosynthesis
MTAGLPIITTDFDGVKELIQDGINGKIVNINDIEKAYAALKYYIGNDEVMKKYGLNCQEKVFNNFTISKMIERTILYYEKIS